MNKGPECRMRMRLPTDYDLYLFREGTHTKAFEFLGSDVCEEAGVHGARFAVWAPNASAVGVAGQFNGWSGSSDMLGQLLDSRGKATGIWAGFIPSVPDGSPYKYHIHWKGGSHLKADPVGFSAEMRPATASIALDRARLFSPGVKALPNDGTPYYERPMNIYEAHLGTWMRHFDGSFMSYDELAERLLPYLKDMGYTHLEVMPINEHPLDQSWGYQATGLYSPTSRHGSPDGLMRFISRMHEGGIGVILDWVPAHFCKDAHGLMNFDGTGLYGHMEHPDWGTMQYDMARGEVRSFLISNALFWLREYGFDGLRIDAVASMLYLDYSRKPGEWRPNRHGGRENLDNVSFLRQLNLSVSQEAPGKLVIAEESTSWPKVSWDVEDGGLGFSYKWNMGWMNDFLRYMKEDPIHRKHHHNLITFAMWYHYSEKFILPLSHDEVVHGKGSLIGKMPGDYWQKFANLRLAMAFMASHPGKKLLFMGGEFAQFLEWRDYEELDRKVLAFEQHRMHQGFVRELNMLYSSEPALWELDSYEEGFRWIDVNNSMQSVASFVRSSRSGDRIVCVHNFTPQAYELYRVGVPEAGVYAQLISTDEARFGGSGVTNGSPVASEDVPYHGMDSSILVRVPPLGSILMKLTAPSPQDGLMQENI